MEMKQGFKQTEIGPIPADWQVAKLGDIASIETGSTPSTAHREFYGDEFLFVSPADLSDAKWINDTGKKLSSIGFGVSRRFPKSSILFTCIGSTIGKCGVANVDLTSNQQINAVLPAPTYDTDFLYYALCLLAPSIRRLAGEQAVPLINKTQFCETLVPFPILSEQKRIATVLNDTDALIDLLDLVLAKKKRLKQAVMQQLLTGKTRLPQFAADWKPSRIGEVLKILHGKSQRGVEDRNGAFPILASGGQIGTANRFLYDKPSVLIGRKGTIDQPQYMETPFWTVDTLFYSQVFEPNCAKFLFYAFCLIQWKQHSEASGVPSLNASTIERIEIRMPPPDEQLAIADVLTDMDKEIASLESQLTKTRELKQGVMQTLLTGKTRLI